MPLANQVNRVDLDHPLGQRVAVFGHGGKSTLAATISRKAGSTHIEMDEIRQLPGWVQRPEKDVLADVRNLMSSNPNGWVTDHQWRPAMELMMDRADSVVVLALPFRTRFWRRFKRSVKRAWTGKRTNGGNRETFRQHFLTRDSAILEMWQGRHRHRRLSETMASFARPGVDFFEIRSARELEQFYKIQGLSRDG